MSQDSLEPGSMSRAEIDRVLDDRFREINIAVPATEGGVLGAIASQALVAQLSGGILAEVARFLGDHAGLLPDKSAVIDAVNAAIDTMLATAGRPLLARLIGPSVKKLIATAVDSMYDAILTPVSPTTEV